MFVVDFLISLVNEEQIELLYKYHIPDSLLSTPQLKEVQSEIKSYAPFLKTVPVRNLALAEKTLRVGPIDNRYRTQARGARCGCT